MFHRLSRQEVLRPTEKSIRTIPVETRAGHFYDHLANRFDNMSNAACIVNRHFQSSPPNRS
jgi:hypothetical protein